MALVTEMSPSRTVGQFLSPILWLIFNKHNIAYFLLTFNTFLCKGGFRGVSPRRGNEAKVSPRLPSQE